MPPVYIATLGMRPEAITVAFDLLHAQYHYERIVILHTDPVHSEIANARIQLEKVLQTDYPGIPAEFHEIRYPNGAPLIDIVDQTSAEAYYRAVLVTLHTFRSQLRTQHLMIAGGRKAMSTYATLAAALLFEPPHDRVWTVLSPDSMVANPGQFHIPPGLRDQVQLVELPLRPARVAPNTPIETLLQPPPSRRDAFLAKLTPAERDVVELLRRNPYETNARLAKIANKSERTIENQLRVIYDKLMSFLEFGENIHDKRQVLLDVVRGE
ncbi:MAG: CRISPR-associated ring nuclease [Anaerolinea sp.]|nr:CRISPR-associated ring nuclease [Anaerolinea sp.]